MKSRAFAVLAVAVVGVALALPAAAQTLVLKANVRFEFNLAGKAMPAGAYVFQMDAGSPVLRVRNFDAEVSVLSLGVQPPTVGRRTGDARLTFNRYGDTYFLSTVVNGHTGVGFEAPITKGERELARSASVQKYEILAVLARQ